MVKKYLNSVKYQAGIYIYWLIQAVLWLVLSIAYGIVALYIGIVLIIASTYAFTNKCPTTVRSWVIVLFIYSLLFIFPIFPMLLMLNSELYDILVVISTINILFSLFQLYLSIKNDEKV